ERGDLRVDADPGELAAVDLGQLRVDPGQRGPVGQVHVGGGQPGLLEHRLVEVEHPDAAELGNAVDRAVQGDLVPGGLPVLPHVDVLLLDAVGQRLDGAALGVRADQLAVQVDQVRRVAGG